MRDFSQVLKNEVETAIVNEPSVFEPLKFYCICILNGSSHAASCEGASEIEYCNNTRARLFKTNDIVI